MIFHVIRRANASDIRTDLGAVFDSNLKWLSSPFLDDQQFNLQIETVRVPRRLSSKRDKRSLVRPFRMNATAFSQVGHQEP